ncbi:MAG: hypothetical protein A3G33_04425 [Omnitrophica bacterium RIFCSPLOWO2_12_FULL_44_17]|uniref:Type II secretion system protein J n=1 Tax=Candidatus Danuiimicrobium aquiferis TaxID=1801832 RepID=A0A1G1KQG4_9BACT|nr:MAG: hypothetical protein A3B72_10635 [Omnitrophica bacterium RIFCSPHIGHO2_02_FULL_45_28]OGW92285.1 MAG: hypothetical protein A3E74_09445 [Omnitrophica bacterium RIFCSPHIGHO2_12_FULL_44_12]OGW95180.1 MAG: hypothetical protein A3G33_04425 [Omnitrophica bacterium RIFCSPLOWO2_12_FULL_44_17]OGX01675.1 MAG: hypothetical protein A3J12_04010 [Omnitrophica bacterium RIFCSPLOWO2_02_FULL_44_11]
MSDKRNLTETASNYAGFTLVELLVVLAIISVTLTVLYTSFRTGLLAYQKMEENLMDRREAEIFMMQFEHELKNAIPYYNKDSEQFFVGDERDLKFPAKLVRYSQKGMEEGLFMVEYQVRGQSLVRKEKKMVKKFKDRSSSREVKETLFNKLKKCRFEYLFVDDSDKLFWDKEWTNSPYLGVPRGVRLIMRGDSFGIQEKSYEILIPHGILLQKNA